MEQKSGFEVEYRVVRPDGSIRFVHDRAFPVFNANGVPYRLAGFATDITECRLAEDSLRDREQLLRSILENSPAAIYLKDRAGRYLNVNRGFEETFGVSREEAIGKTAHDLFRKEDADQLRADDLKVLQSHSLLQFEQVLSLQDGRHTFLSSKVPLLDSSGAAYAVCGVATEITARKQAEDALRDREQLLESILDNSPTVIYLKDREGSYLKVNRQYEKIAGATREEMVGRTDYDLFPKEVADYLRDHDQTVLSGGYPAEFEETIPLGDGPHTFISMRFPLFDAAGKIYALGGVSTDITERKRTEAALLLEVTNVLVSNLDVKNLFNAVSASIQQVVDHKYASLALYDPQLQKLRVQRVTVPAGGKSLPEEFLVSLDESSAGWVFRKREPVVLNRIGTVKLPAEVFRKNKLLKSWISAGVKSACWMPLTHRDHALGVMIVASTCEVAFGQQEVRLLTQVANQIAVALDNALAFRQIADSIDRLAQEKLYLEDELKTEYNFDEIIGDSAALKRVLRQVETVAKTDANVLILGETGTGKELIARAIHNLSPRRDHTFVKLNCAAIPTGLLESELFGHEKGAFTGAISRKIGRLELASGGTLLLDEVGDIPLELQPKLLRALQEKEFERLGSTRTIPVDVRLLASTNRDLGRMVQEGRFRGDLYYRLSVFPITIPPLRERTEDIPLLVHYFLQKHALRTDKGIKTIPPEVMQALTRWHWPGNVREMENLIERAVILSQGSSVLRIPLSELRIPDAAPPAADSATLESVEREHILQVLRETKGVIAGPEGAAAKLGLKRTTLNFRMRKLGITRADI